ncbi:MAG: helix-turn-helix transcriptional regulator [Ruminococcaceae bacterium]|nr:helix-turn-helix transcriptional regulator [Oscillospiraceae bacterium]
MNIGERIRELRISKLMTQADLAGDRITRNMLSCIENGSANPSLSTIVYIAGRLGVPAGFLLAEQGDEMAYRKMSNLSNIKKAYTTGDVQSCRSLCLSGCPEPDDEISLLLANCDAEIAVEEFWRGRLRSSCRFFDEALSYAEKTIYSTDAIEAEIRVYFRLMERISHTLYSDLLDEEKTLSVKSNSIISQYLDALESLDNGDVTVAQTLIEQLSQTSENSFFEAHLQSKVLILQKNYKQAQKALLQLLQDDETPLNKIELYTVLGDLEVCCRESEDYKNAYRYASEKVELVEQLLKEY